MNLGTKQRYLKETTIKMKSYTKCYLPPEVLDYWARLKNINTAKKGEVNTKFEHGKIDVYCWGMSFYQIMSHHTFEQLDIERRKFKKKGKDYTQFLRLFDTLQVPGRGGELLKKQMCPILKQCLHYNPVDRPTFEQIATLVDGINLA